MVAQRGRSVMKIWQEKIWQEDIKEGIQGRYDKSNQGRYDKRKY